MTESKLYYRCGFNQSIQPFTEIRALVGTNDKARVRQAFLAPYDPDTGDVDMARIHSTPMGENGHPNGYFPELAEAQQGVIEALEGQKSQIEAAIQEVKKMEAPQLAIAE